MNAVQAADRERFLALMGNGDFWASVDEMVDYCDKQGYWPDDLLRTAQANAKKQHIRQLMQSMKDEDGFRLFASVETADENGKKVRKYKQETLFDVDDYRQVVNYHLGVAQHHKTVAEEYAKRCKSRFNVQLKLHFAEEFERPRQPR